LLSYAKHGDFAEQERVKMSDEKKFQDEELDKVSGGVSSHPIPIDPIKPGGPPTHPIMPGDPIKGKTNPVG
jgi:hypothetical protein